MRLGEIYKMVDKIGQEIKVGCFIAYGHALGRCAGLRIGRVESINEKFEKDQWEKGKIHDLSTVTVLGINDDWYIKKPKLLEKRSILYFPNRMIVLPNLPDNYSKLYEKDCVALGKKHSWKKNGFYEKVCMVCGLNPHSYLSDGDL